LTNDYPQNAFKETGPIEVIPGSHFTRTETNDRGHLRNVKLAEATTAPAGSIFIAVYSIWHRKGRNRDPQSSHGKVRPSASGCI
jgi:ectoine hydroxylase-related dioxygenase (phytanoyl-CoA dioxygenase family)